MFTTGKTTITTTTQFCQSVSKTRYRNYSLPIHTLLETHSGYTDHSTFTLHAKPSIKPYHRGLGHLCQTHCTAQYLGGQSRFCHRKRNQYTLMVPKWTINKEINISYRYHIKKFRLNVTLYYSIVIQYKKAPAWASTAVASFSQELTVPPPHWLASRRSTRCLAWEVRALSFFNLHNSQTREQAIT